jgi:tetratricopeptide (TPR) repeat protein
MFVKGLVLRFRRFLWRKMDRPGPPPGITLEYAGDLFERGMALVDQGHAQQALSIARELDGYKYTGGVELEAVALHELGEADRAIEVLQSGIEKTGVWRIGHRLGIYLSDEGRYEEALQAFEASLTMRQAEPMVTRYNQAIVHNRVGRTDVAIELLKDVISAEPSSDEPKAVELATGLLAELTDNRPKNPPPRRRTIGPTTRNKRRR